MENANKIDFSDTKIAFARLKDWQLKRAYWLFKVLSRPWLVTLGPKLAQISLAAKLPLNSLLKSTIFSHFCGGESIDECRSKIAQLAESNIGTILDFASEGQEKLQEALFEATVEEVCRTIDLAAAEEKVPFAVFKPSGICSVSILEKKDRKLALNEEETQQFELAKDRFERICSYAHKTGVRIFVDAEESWIQDTIDQLTLQMMQRYNRDKVIVYNTFQMYRRDRLEFLKFSYGDASAKNYLLGVKLVRGAYLEKEASRAKSKGYPNPIHVSKEATDQDYNLALRFCVENIKRISICAGTHNERSTKLLAQLMAEAQLPNDDERVYFSQLLGMSDHLSFNLAHHGYQVAKYMPYGPLKLLLPYLSRRAAENSSIRGQTSRELGLIEEEMERRRLKL